MFYRASLVSQLVKNLPAMRVTWVRCLGQEYPLEEGSATHSNTLACRIPWTEEPGWLQSMGLQRVGHDWAFHACARMPFPLCRYKSLTYIIFLLSKELLFNSFCRAGFCLRVSLFLLHFEW